MKGQTLAILALGGFVLWALTLRRDPTYTGIEFQRDTGWNYPPIYPDVTGSGAVDPTGASWPGWATPPFNPAGYPGGTVGTNPAASLPVSDPRFDPTIY